MSKKRKLLFIIIGIMGTCIFLLSYNREKVVEYLCSDTELARLNAGQNREFVISADGDSWKVPRGIYYEIIDNGKIVSAKNVISFDRNDEEHAYTLIYAEHFSLVGLVETSTSPHTLRAIYNFNSGESWPRLRNNESSIDINVKRKWRGIFERLKSENPDLRMPYEIQE